MKFKFGDQVKINRKNCGIQEDEIFYSNTPLTVVGLESYFTTTSDGREIHYYKLHDGFNELKASYEDSSLEKY